MVHRIKCPTNPKSSTTLQFQPVGVTQDVFDPQAKHYITLITCAKLAAGSAPLTNMEPHKCEGWEWVTLQELAERRDECFKPLQHALETFFGGDADIAALWATGQGMDWVKP